MPDLLVTLHVSSADWARFAYGDTEHEGTVYLDDDLIRDLKQYEGHPQKYGRKLFDAVLPKGPLREAYASAKSIARSRHGRIRLRLHLSLALAQAVQELLWEMMLDAELDQALACSREVTLSRFYSSGETRIPPLMPQLRALCVISAPGDLRHFGVDDIDYGETRRELEYAFQSAHQDLDVEFLGKPATLERLNDTLRTGEFNVVYIYGHGLRPKDPGGDSGKLPSTLLLENANGGGVPAEEKDLAQVFVANNHLRLVVLAACHGGASSSGSPLSGLAGSLVRHGVPAVVGMRRTLFVRDAQPFTKWFFKNLVDSGYADVAVNEARNQLFFKLKERQAPGEPQKVDWSTPILFMRMDGRIYDRDPIPVDDPEPGGGIQEPDGRIKILKIAALLGATMALVLLLVYGPRIISSGPSLPSDPPVDLEEIEPPPPEPTIDFEKIEPGMIGIAAVDRDTLEWSSNISRIIQRHYAKKWPKTNTKLVPGPLRPKLQSFVDDDVSILPGGDQAPYGMEYILLVAQTYGEIAAKLDPLPAVSVSCETMLVSTRTPEVRRYGVVDKPGKGATMSAALDQAFGRCIESSIDELP